MAQRVAVLRLDEIERKRRLHRARRPRPARRARSRTRRDLSQSSSRAFSVVESCRRGAGRSSPTCSSCARFSRAAINGRCRRGWRRAWPSSCESESSRASCSSRGIVTPAHCALPPETAGRAAPTAGLGSASAAAATRRAGPPRLRADYQAAGRPANTAARQSDRKACSSSAGCPPRRAPGPARQGSSLATSLGRIRRRIFADADVLAQPRKCSAM